MILIDSRIGSREIAPCLARGIKHQLTTLAFGDCAWIGNGPGAEGAAFIGVERKRLRDFLNSMETGRLTGHQLIGMANTYHYSYVVVEGVWRENKSGVIETPKGGGRWAPLELGSRRFTASTMDNFCNSLRLQLNVTVVHTPTLERTSSWISNTYRWWTSKRWEQHRACQKKNCVGVPVPINGEKAPLLERVLVEFSGVGADRAKKIAAAVGSVKALVKMTASELSQIEGIGLGTAQKIVKEINEGGPCVWCGEFHKGGPENCSRT